MKQFSLLRNYWALLSTYRNLIYATEAHALKLMAACFNDMKDEESLVRRTRKLSARFLRQFEQHQKERHCSKVNLVMNWER